MRQRRATRARSIAGDGFGMEGTPDLPRYELGQVFEHVGGMMSKDYNRVVVVEVRDEDHPKGMGAGLPSALAVPYAERDFGWRDSLDRAHPLDVVILCRALPHHGDNVWRLIAGT